MHDLRLQFSNLYDQHIDSIFRFVYLKVSSRETAEDLCAEIFVRVWRGFGHYEIANHRAYLYQVARSVVADHYRSSKIQFTEGIDVIEIMQENTASLEEQADLSLTMDRIMEVLRQLPEDYQNLVIWRYLDELSIAEIAQILEKREENVRMALHRALHAMKSKLALDSPDSSDAPTSGGSTVIPQAVFPSSS